MCYNWHIRHHFTCLRTGTAKRGKIRWTLRSSQRCGWGICNKGKQEENAGKWKLLCSKIRILIYDVLYLSENFSADGSLWKVSRFPRSSSLTSVKLEIYSKLRKFIFVSVIFTDFLLGSKLITSVCDSKNVQVPVLWNKICLICSTVFTLLPISNWKFIAATDTHINATNDNSPGFCRNINTFQSVYNLTLLPVKAWDTKSAKITLPFQLVPP
jgi:hypothetical protein